MTRDEVTKLLAVAQTYDQRTVGESDVVAWSGVVGDLHFADARDAVVAHFGDSTDRLMPAHVRRRVLAALQDRAMRALPANPNAHVPMPAWFHDEVAKHRRLTHEANVERKAAGLAPDFGEAIVTSADRGQRSYR